MIGMKWNRVTFLSIAIIALVLSTLSFPRVTDARKTLFFPHIYLLKDAKMYNSISTAKKSVATLAAGQALTIVDSDQTDFWDREANWYLVKTWLGNKWIKAGEDNIYTGTYTKLDQTITTVFDVELYDHPGTKPTSRTIKPGKHHAMAQFNYFPATAIDATDLSMTSEEHWYQIGTPEGKKWLKNPAFLENVRETPVSSTVKLTGTETAYPTPFAVESEGESIEPQIVHIVGEWKFGFGPWAYSWLKVRLPQGDRWLFPKHRMIADYLELNESITLQTETRYFQQPLADSIWNEKANWLKPGTYEAYESSGDYVHIKTEQGDVWVNPNRSLLERPLGIVPTKEQIKLTKNSSYFAFPAAGETSHNTGFYKPQTVQAFEKWTSGQGNVYYHFHGFGGDEWVMVS
jgi:hypothetical protein